MFVCEGQDLNQAFKSCSIAFVWALLQIYCVYLNAKAVSTGYAWFTKAISTRTCANMFNHMEFIPFPSSTAEPDAAQENACVAVFQASVGLFSEACVWQ